MVTIGQEMHITPGIKRAVKTTREYILPLLRTAGWGGTQVFVDISLRMPRGEQRALYDTYIDSGARDSRSHTYPIVTRQVRERSVQLGVAYSDIIRLVRSDEEGESLDGRNVILPLAHDIKLIVTCAGLAPVYNEAVAGHICYGILLALPLL